MSFCFKPSDFKSNGVVQLIFRSVRDEDAVTCVDAADKANALLKEYVASLPVVATIKLAGEEDNAWHEYTRTAYYNVDYKPTHSARLWDVSELPRSACVAGEHEADMESIARPNTLRDLKCKHCGVKLKAKWEAE
jgi:hypothetical protein